ncbi:hypothetical protein KAR10_01375 [bacterium]|nr:hypothetical protein [bacterium]
MKSVSFLFGAGLSQAITGISTETITQCVLDTNNIKKWCKNNGSGYNVELNKRADSIYRALDIIRAVKEELNYEDIYYILNELARDKNPLAKQLGEKIDSDLKLVKVEKYHGYKSEILRAGLHPCNWTTLA